MHRTTIERCGDMVGPGGIGGRPGHGECVGVNISCSCGFHAEYSNEPTARARAAEHEATEPDDVNGYAFDDDDRCDNCGEYDAVAFPIYGRTYTDRWISAVVGSVRYCESCARVAGLRY